MPYLTEKLALRDPFLDRRTKLLPCQRERVLALRQADGLTDQAIAEIMGVSKRLINFLLNPDKLERHKELAALRQADGRYYDRERHNKAIREHRQHKNALLAVH